MKKLIATIKDYAVANIVYTILVIVWLLMIGGTVEHVRAGTDSMSDLAWVVFAPAVFFLLVPLKSPDVRAYLWSKIKQGFHASHKSYAHLGIDKSKPLN
jgi:hypothetical protein